MMMFEEGQLLICEDGVIEFQRDIFFGDPMYNNDFEVNGEVLIDPPTWVWVLLGECS